MSSWTRSSCRAPEPDTGLPEARPSGEVLRRPRQRRRWDQPRHREGRVPHAPRPERLWEDDDADDDRGLRGAHQRRHRARRRGSDAPQAVRAQHRRRLPELRAVPPHDRPGERRLSAAHASISAGAAGRARARNPRPGRAAPIRRQASAPALRRPAAARRARTWPRLQPGRPPAGRAARSAGQEPARADAGRAQAHPPGSRHHDGVRDTRPDRGDDDVRPNRGLQPRHARADGGPARGVSPPAHSLRGRVHRR